MKHKKVSFKIKEGISFKLVDLNMISFVKVSNRCVLTGRSRGVLNRFKMSRIMFRMYAHQGLINGVVKSSW